MLRLFSTVRHFHVSRIALVKVVEKVPALGESITEGTIAKWNKVEGDKVAIDDVIVVVETDKVTVDIKSTHAGIITKRFASENVTVGHELYEIDIDGASANSASAPKSNPAPAATTAKEDKEPKHSAGARVPLIKFVGKRSKAPQSHAPAAPAAPAVPKATQSSPAKVIKESGKAVDFTTLQGLAFFGRPTFSVREIAAIESGGATEN